ncbi:MAG TPA: hypothetical protein VFU55_06395 [Terracidiphilus sp.]|nr:hypothetical protein [Terracidiphilus sp.]
MTAPAIPIASPQAGVSASRGSGISAMPGRGAQANGSSRAEGAGDGQWQQSLRQAGVRQQDSSQDSPISAVNGSGAGDAQASDPAGVQAAQIQQIHSLHARAQALAALNAGVAKQLAQDASTAAKAETATEKAAGLSGNAAHAKTSGKADAHQKGATSNPAQNLLASLTLPAEVTVAALQANSKPGAGATAADGTLKDSLLPSADAATALFEGSLPGSESGSTAGKLAAAAEKGIAGSPASNVAAHLEGQAQQGTLPAGVGDNPALSASASQASADAALAAGSAASAQAAAQNAAQASSGNANTLARGLHAVAAASHPAGSVSADSNGKIQSSSGDSSSAGHAHAASGRDAAATPAQGSGAGISMAANGQVQAVSAAGHAALNGQDARGISGVPASSASGAHSGDPFSTLDSGSLTNSRIDSTGDSATWMHAGTHMAEAGFQDPSLGWVAVRAQLSGGVVQASILPATADAAQALGGHMAGLHAYLADHHALEGAVTMARPEASAGWSGAGHSQGQGSGQGSSYGSNQGGDAPFYGGSSGGQSGGSSRQPGGVTLESVRGISRATAMPAAAAVRTSSSIAARGGGLISVVA